MPIRQFNLAEAYGQAENVRNAQMIGRLNEMKIRDYERKATREQQKRNIFAQFTPSMQTTGQPMGGQPPMGQLPTPTGQAPTGAPARPAFDYSGAGTALTRGGFPEEGMEMGKYGAEMRQTEANILKAHSEAGVKEQESIRKNFEMLGRGASAVMGEYNSRVTGGMNPTQATQEVQPMYAQALYLLKSQGVDVSNISPQFDPMQTKMAATLALSVKDKLTIAQAEKVAKAGAPKVTTQITMEKPFWSEMGKMFGKDIVEDRKSNQENANMVQTIQDAKGLLDEGIYTGAGANVRLGFDKWLQEVNLNVAGEKAATTEAYAALTGKLVGNIIKQFGAGTGLSDADREYAEKIVGGKITLTEGALRRLLDINEKAYRIQINQYNKRALKIMGRKEARNFPFTLTVDVPETQTGPTSAPQAGIDSGQPAGQPRFTIRRVQ